MANLSTVIRVNEVTDWDYPYRCHLPGIGGTHRTSPLPPSDHGRDVEAADRYVHGRQPAEDLDSGPIQPGLFSRLAERGVGKIEVFEVSGTARKGDLAGVGAQRGGALDEHHLRTARAVANQDQDRRLPGAITERRSQGRDVRKPIPLAERRRQRLEPAGQCPATFRARSMVQGRVLRGSNDHS
jgi:hypothetical protein